MLLPGLGVAGSPKTVGVPHDAPELVVGAQGVAAGRDEVDDGFEVLLGEVRVGTRRADLLVESGKLEGF